MSAHAPEPASAGGWSESHAWLPRLVRDQRVAFLVVGGVNTVVGYLCFAALLVIGGQWHYLMALAGAHVISVLIAFVLHRYLVFRVRGNLLRDLFRFESVYLLALGVNFVLLPILVEVVGLPVLAAQALIVVVTSVISWLGHRNFSFRRPLPAEELPR